MPEEKVSLPCYADENSGVTIHRGGCGECAPAADAGPRQSDTCKHCNRPIEVRNGEWRHVGYNGAYCFKPAEPAAPPVPQEAAPTPHKEVMSIETESIRPRPVAVEGEHRASIETSATAPDAAMRVAREVTERLKGLAHEAGNYDGNPKPHCDQCAHDEAAILDAAEALEPHSATLIREAGSERERRLTSVLFVIMSDMPKKRDWLDPDIEREASRLLGGESK